ncbi:Vitamin B12 import ATP-binding protein BtuD [Neobacillus rhizosphaerae]|uniref:Vitamin B12 import ATP-binding protein BtuD n=1 Tax=Neobacillus rhizosphaerae TaxID=2880965 RepID=A0ABM9ET25_9BACI|nr:ABC transporter ATP-binding protein [Neobacillus rhizosphaerae]CAH2715799.1 Vitamin B12 import ATP-binding protein BtuD [Neobacillus rhizosphaerae]
MSVIECQGLTKAYGGVKALNNFSCNIEENKITGLIGRNGAGKTTLLKIIAGFMKETSGDLKVFSESPFNNLTVSANVVFIHDQMDLPTALNLKELLEVAASFYQNWDRELANRLFDYFSLSPLQHYEGLSKGMKSTFNMILGLAARVPLTLFDEPTSGMDAAVRQDFYRALLKDYLAHPRTIIISSHHLNEIEDLLEDILLMKDGKELLHMPIADLKEWAIGLQGKTAIVDEWTQNKELIFTKNIGPDQSYVVVRNNFSETEWQSARIAGIDLTPVSSSDLCVYLTSKTKGGIDDVFNKG